MNSIRTPQDLMKFLEKNLRYGFVANDKVFTEPFSHSDMDKYYKLRTGEDLVKAGYGVCWDVAEFERLFFEKQKIEHECYYVQAFKPKTNESGPSHTFLLYKEDTQWKWFEYTWKIHTGIHEYKTREEALSDIVDKYLQYAKQGANDIRLYKYAKAKAGLNTFEFVSHCYNGKRLPLAFNNQGKSEVNSMCDNVYKSSENPSKNVFFRW